MSDVLFIYICGNSEKGLTLRKIYQTVHLICWLFCIYCIIQQSEERKGRRRISWMNAAVLSSWNSLSVISACQIISAFSFFPFSASFASIYDSFHGYEDGWWVGQHRGGGMWLSTFIQLPAGTFEPRAQGRRGLGQWFSAEYDWHLSVLSGDFLVWSLSLGRKKIELLYGLGVCQGHSMKIFSPNRYDKVCIFSPLYFYDLHSQWE